MLWEAVDKGQVIVVSDPIHNIINLKIYTFPKIDLYHWRELVWQMYSMQNHGQNKVYLEKKAFIKNFVP